MKQNLLFILCLFSFSYAFGATVTWDNGGGDGNWATATNWDTNTLPGSGDDAVIPTGFTVTISTDIGTVKSLTVDGTSNLTLTSSGKLTINGSTAIGIQINTGILTNAGTVKVDNTSGNGMNIRGEINNSGTIEIGQTGSVNTGIIMALTTPKSTNQSTGIIRIDNSTAVGIDMNPDFDNFGLIEIGQNTTISNNCLTVRATSTFDNKPGATVKLDRTAGSGIQFIFGGTFSNSGALEIGQTAAISQDGITNLNAGTFTNQSTGTVKIDNIGGIGIHVFPGSFDNHNTVTIGAIGSVNIGIRHRGGGTVTNQPGATINISNVTTEAIEGVVSPGTFTNGGTINLGNTAVVRDGIHTDDAAYTFINNGTVNFKNVSGNAISVVSTTLARL